VASTDMIALPLISNLEYATCERTSKDVRPTITTEVAVDRVSRSSRVVVHFSRTSYRDCCEWGWEIHCKSFLLFKSRAFELLGKEKLTTTHRKLDSSDSDTKRISLQMSLLGLKLWWGRSCSCHERKSQKTLWMIGLKGTRKVGNSRLPGRTSHKYWASVYDVMRNVLVLLEEGYIATFRREVIGWLVWQRC